MNKAAGSSGYWILLRDKELNSDKGLLKDKFI